jgi:photosynthetic reaction center cytochrome c subunit
MASPLRYTLAFESESRILRSAFMTVKQILPEFLFVLLAFIGISSSGLGQQANRQTVIRRNARSDAQNARIEPADANRCQFCHSAEVAGYAQSAMAHSLRKAGQEPDGTVDAHGTKITMHSTPDGYSQRLQDGSEVDEYRVDYVVGSGNHASGYLVDLGGHLFQSPVAFYRSRNAYDLAPGFEDVLHPDFTRPIREGCVFCHSGTALPVAGTLNRYRAPIFPAEAITCGRCHGPAEKHLADPQAGTILNPAKLEPAARDSICEQCHLFGAARVLNPEKTFRDFLPGQPLEQTFTVYHNVLPAGAVAGTLKVISHVEQLALSVCARSSNQKLWCGTCHDPHDKPAEPVAYYRSRCLSCHAGSFPATHPAKDSNCLTCHMPRRDAKDGGHTAFTDHRIQRRPEVETNTVPDGAIAAWREPSADLQKRNLGIALIDIGMQRHSGAMIGQGYRTLTDVQQQFSRDSDFFTWLGQALLLAKQSGEAQIALERALQLNPNSAIAEADAASPYLQSGDTRAATAHLERALAIDPLYLPAASQLIGLYQLQHEDRKAEALSAKVQAVMREGAGPDKAALAAATGELPKRGNEIFKNIRVMKGIPSEELIPAMRFITASLAVKCEYCHVEGHFDKDDKKPKQVARKMMQMMFALNQNNFTGNRSVTCYSCHRGAAKPVAVPDVAGEMPAGGTKMGETANGETEKLSLPSSLPTVNEVIDHYISAMGGAAAIEKISSRLEEGTANILGQSGVVKIFGEAPNKQAIVRHLPAGDDTSVFDGATGWFSATGHPLRDMHGAELAAARMDADLHFPLNIRRLFPQLRIEYPEKIGKRYAYMLVGVSEGRPPVKLYFDQQSGLLVRLVRYVESPLGLYPTSVDYADYREVDNVEIPFRRTIIEPGSKSTIQLQRVQQNVSIDAGRFVRPVPTMAPQRPASQ